MASVSLPVAKAYDKGGIKASIEEYNRIKGSKANQYKLGIGELTGL